MDATQTTIYYAIIIASILVGTILVFFIVILIRNHRRSQALYKAKIKAEITTLENERKRIAADLHDSIGPVLVGIKMKINSISVSEKEDQETIEDAVANIEGMMGKLKEISNDLLPTVLLKKGLTQALIYYLDDISKHSNLQTHFKYDELCRLTEQTAINIYRIVHELTHNTMKHAKANNLYIDLIAKDGLLVLTTKDDGIGFDYENAMKNHLGLGLRNLLSRAELLGGRMYIDSKPNGGTTYNFEIPLQ